MNNRIRKTEKAKDKLLDHGLGKIFKNKKKQKRVQNGIENPSTRIESQK
jgi:hypothetical protein